MAPPSTYDRLTPEQIARIKVRYESGQGTVADIAAAHALEEFLHAVKPFRAARLVGDDIGQRHHARRAEQRRPLLLRQGRRGGDERDGERQRRRVAQRSRANPSLTCGAHLGVTVAGHG